MQFKYNVTLLCFWALNTQNNLIIVYNAATPNFIQT